MSGLKTRPTRASVARFLDAVPDADRRGDCKTIARLMKQATGARPVMWGTSIVGFGSYDYRYETGREGKWFLTGFSPRKHDLTLYIMAGFDGYGALLKRLGRHKAGVSCLYLKRLGDVDLNVLRTLIDRSVQYIRQRYKGSVT